MLGIIRNQSETRISFCPYMESRGAPQKNGGRFGKTHKEDKEHGLKSNDLGDSGGLPSWKV